MIARLLIWLAVLLMPVMAVAGNGYTFNERFPSSKLEAFENAVRKVNPDCMPSPYPLEAEFYPLRVGKAALANCGSDEQVRKYSKYILHLKDNPAVTIGMLDDLKIDAAQCVLNTFIDADSTLNAYQKDDYKSVVNAGISVANWYGLVKGLSQLRAADADSFLTTLMSARERNLELAALYHTDVGGRILDTLLTKRYKHVLALGYYRERCEYDAAALELENLRTATYDACVEAGHAYRQAERNLRHHSYTFRLPLQEISGNNFHEEFDLLVDALESKMRLLEQFEDHYTELEQLDRDLPPEAKTFAARRKAYRTAFDTAQKAIPTAASCRKLDPLTEALALANGTRFSCRPAFYGAGEDALPHTDELVAALAQEARTRSAAYWARLDRIRGLHMACKTGERDREIAALREEMRTHPGLRYDSGACHMVAQPQLEQELDRMTAGLPEHCQMTAVPRDILRLPTSEAVRALEEARLFVLGAPTRVPPKADEPEGIVVDSAPAPGEPVRVWTGVALTVTGPQPEPEEEPELATVPAILGLTEAKALSALAEAGLNGVVGKRIPADRLELKPGFVHAAVPGPGRPAAMGSAVSLTVIGPRPMIDVPSLAGAKTEAQAQGILAEAGFVPGPAAAGHPAPEGEEPGTFYDTDPPGPGPYPMFTTLRPLAFTLPAPPAEPEMRPVPPVKGLEPGKAQDMIRKDGFFEVGTVSAGKPATGNEKPGTVQSTAPGIGQPAPEGTTVDLFVAAPAVAIDAPEDPAQPAEPAPLAAGDGDWMGFWELSDFSADSASAQQSLSEAVLRFRVENADGRLMFRLYSNRNGEWKRFINFPADIDDGGILRADPSFLRELEAKMQADAAKGEVAQLTKMVFGALKELEMTRKGVACSIRLYDVGESQMITLDARCRRL
ncbi:PASTA domain-containing protein [Celeribacter neptunius]|uniref:PASTA domain, binds beta-lactams n=1 Tax=Celeribacter neptunius TaxID=588602 RepID=A0A1I3VKU8_9RHOB|nr:PASTA domain-containing protein [Celeribacter neptunius]SFJ95885.1 PASTA domain, binds beta-lactams [Celeribacter neptunius]